MKLAAVSQWIEKKLREVVKVGNHDRHTVEPLYKDIIIRFFHYKEVVLFLEVESQIDTYTVVYVFIYTEMNVGIVLLCVWKLGRFIV